MRTWAASCTQEGFEAFRPATRRSARRRFALLRAGAVATVFRREALDAPARRTNGLGGDRAAWTDGAG